MFYVIFHLKWKASIYRTWTPMSSISLNLAPKSNSEASFPSFTLSKTRLQVAICRVLVKNLQIVNPSSNSNQSLTLLPALLLGNILLHHLSILEEFQVYVIGVAITRLLKKRITRRSRRLQRNRYGPWCTWAAGVLTEFSQAFHQTHVGHSCSTCFSSCVFFLSFG